MADNTSDEIKKKSYATLLDTVRVTDLHCMSFIIKDYQRGYRWNARQARELLCDIDDFPIKNEDDWYCLQPLVVKPIREHEAELRERLKRLLDRSDMSLEEIRDEFKSNTTYEVIDGQQRLTTLFIIIKYLEKKSPFSIEYETRDESKAFLEDILVQNDEEMNNKYIDFYNMVAVRNEIIDWFKHHTPERFKEKMKHVRFIWYETGEDAIEVFERLNIGKIALTNSELIKALFLNRYNFKQEADLFKVEQQKMALAWDTIEQRLQDDEFWLFIHSRDWDRPTRIDFIFDIICEEDSLSLKALTELDDDGYQRILGGDQYRTFRYFYEYIEKKSENREAAITDCWDKVSTIFHILEEWYTDIRLYHYIGFLVENAPSDRKIITDLIKEWTSTDQSGMAKTKNEFKNVVTDKIKDVFRKNKNSGAYWTLDELRYGNPKTKQALLLYNIETIVRQNRAYEKENKYRMETFYRFPFHLYKKEVSEGNKGWDVEHIDSAYTNPLTLPKEQNDWIMTAYIELDPERRKEFKSKVTAFLSDVKQKDEKKSFQTLCDELIEVLPHPADPLKEDADENKNEKHKIWNLTLLDSGTNRGYKNAIFPAKRRCIIGRDKGEIYNLEFTESGDIVIKATDAAITFIPPCTKNAFMKYHTPDSNNILTWGRHDAEMYLKDIVNVLKPFTKEK